MSQRHILISGAGVAGLTLAYWLLRAECRVTVVEKYPKLRAAGQSIDIRQAAVDVIHYMNIEQAVRAKTMKWKGFAFIDRSGQSFASFETDGSTETQGLISEYEILRGDLIQIFYDLVKDNPNIAFIFNDQVTATKPARDNQVEVSFRNETTPATYDLVVAADGQWSKIRSMVFTSEGEVQVNPIDWFSAVFTINQDILHEDTGFANMLTLPKGRSVMAALDTMKNTKAGMMFAVPKHQSALQSQLRDAARNDNNRLRQLLVDALPENHWVMPELKKGILESSDFYGSEYAQVFTKRLYRDRVVLLGDAGYCAPMTGMGTSLAIIGAYILAGEILTQTDDLDTAAAAYESTMLPFIEKIQPMPPFVQSFMGPQTEWGLWFRNSLVSVVSYLSKTFIASFLSKLGSAIPAFSKAEFRPRDYSWPSTAK